MAITKMDILFRQSISIKKHFFLYLYQWVKLLTILKQTQVGR